MSWFSQGEKPGEEVADGVRVERRAVLRLSLGAAALLAATPRAALGQGKDDDGELAWDAFLKTAVPMAEKLVQRKKPNEESYLLKMASLLARLKAAPDATFAAGEVASASVYDKKPFVVLQFKLAPGAALAFHDHRDYVGILSAVTGQARVRSFDLVGDDRSPPKGKTFLIAETHDALLTPGRYSHLSRRIDNIHDIRAGKEGARLLDVFTFFKEDGTSVFLDVGEKPKDAEKRHYEASWK